MAEAGVFSVIQSIANDYFYGFDKKQLEINLMSGKIVLRSALIRPDKINEILDESMAPMNIKAGMMRNVHIQFNKMQLLHEFTTGKFTRKKKQADTNAISITIEEVLFILGTSTANVSKDDEFEDWDIRQDEDVDDAKLNPQQTAF
jgi:hypothetical protein